ncbi:hypothetical protein LOK49_LG04G01803 [Camellia lanceoleosa]|uniref:Uncharacterized protein n=1 Tax=Camellia lanceoleosa TaxID=1840588 RepID=A0ACC0I8C5_9ERIC|nr:hypothetical protein LOK49_LG04G01803 [Camellia lanceoleosa]
MKLGDDHNDYEPFKSTDNPEEMEILKLDKAAHLEDEYIGTWHLGKLEYQVNSDSFLHSKGNRCAVRNIVKFHGFMTEDDSIDRNECTTLYAKTPLELQQMEDRTGHYTDASIMDCEMPERVIFPQEGNYQVVKDICVDREIKCSIENCELDHNVISCLLNSDADTDIELTNEAPKATVASSISNASESFLDHDCIKDAVEQCGSMNFSMELNGDFDARTGQRGEQKDHKFQVPNMATEVASKTEIETKSITHDCDSLVTRISGREKTPGIADYQPPLETGNLSEVENGISEKLMTSSQAYDHGESSFSAVGPLSGSIAFSGPMSYSGSISLRSNSSNSVRSFAFPVLSSEWNGSPVRMMEADRRHLKKHRCWRTGFLCCKF